MRHRQKTVVTDMCYPTEISSLMDFGTPDCSLGKGTAALQKTRCCLGDSKKWAWWRQTQSCQLDLWVQWGVKAEQKAAQARGWWEQSDNSTWCLTTRALPSITAFDLSQLNNVFCFPMQDTEVLTPNWETRLILREKHFTLQTALIWMELYWCLLR